MWVRLGSRWAGTIAAATYNVHRRKGVPFLKADRIFPDRETDVAPPTSWRDFAHLEHLMGPTPSIRSKVAQA